MVIRIWVERADPLTGSAAAGPRGPIRFEGWMELLRVIADLVSSSPARDFNFRRSIMKSLAVDRTGTFLTGNVGGGLKWYGGRWGLRGDYRFLPVRSKDDAPEFFGRDTRYGHRGSVLSHVVQPGTTEL